MTTVLVTGSGGFIGKNLLQALRRRGDLTIRELTRASEPSALRSLVSSVDVVFHLAGVNRPERESDFTEVNVGLTQRLLEAIEAAGGRPHIVFTSSTQAELDNPYGRSKRAAEELIQEFSQKRSSTAALYRLPGVFGKWSRPFYNTVVATFCHQFARGEEASISDSDRQLRLVYIDDVVRAFNDELAREKAQESPVKWGSVEPELEVSLGGLARRLREIAAGRAGGVMPDLSEPLTKRLYATYLSFVPSQDWARGVDLRSDQRGWLFELVRSGAAGQIFVSKTHVGFTRGNHYHDTKVEKFCVVEGEAVIRLRSVQGTETISFAVNGEDIRVVDIPVGYTHSIENTGDRPVITLFWASEVFDPDVPDTYPLQV